MTVLYIGIGTVALPDDVVLSIPVVYYPIPVKFIPPSAGFFICAYPAVRNAIFRITPSVLFGIQPLRA